MPSDVGRAERSRKRTGLQALGKVQTVQRSKSGQEEGYEVLEHHKGYAMTQ